MLMRMLVVRAENGKIVETTTYEGDLKKVLKEVISKALELWDPEKSDLVVMRHNQDINVKLPITPQQFERYSQFNLRRAGNVAIFTVPVYVISFENEWSGESLRDTKVFVVAPYVDEIVESAVKQLAVEITSPSEE